MKQIFVALLAFVWMTSAAVADGPIVLRAKTGQTIRIWFAPPRYDTTGESESTSVEGVHIVVDGGIPGTTRVVLINNCVASNSYSYKSGQAVYNCAYGNDGTWISPDYCGGNVSTSILTYAANHSGSINCYQQIAISPTYNQWLVDSIGGENNFNFRFPTGRLR